MPPTWSSPRPVCQPVCAFVPTHCHSLSCQIMAWRWQPWGWQEHKQIWDQAKVAQSSL
jgi:hypothetical protein